MNKIVDIFVSEKDDMRLALAVVKSTINGKGLIQSEYNETAKSIRMKFTVDTKEKQVTNDMNLLGLMTHYKGIVTN